MWTLDRNTQLLAKYIRGCAMVHVRVRQDHFFGFGIHRAERFENTLHLATGVDDRRLAGSCALDDGAILLVGRYRNDVALKGHIDGCKLSAVA